METAQSVATEAARQTRAEVRAPGWLRASFAITEQVAPALSVKWAHRLLFTPRKFRVRPAQRTFLDTATRFDVDTKHGRVAAYSWGEGGQTVLLAHGWGGHAGQWSGLVPALRAAGLRVIALDMPGHGASESGPSSFVQFGDALSAVARVAGNPRAIIAHSMGAVGATLALAQHQMSAERLVFLSAPARLEPYWARFRDVLGMSQSGWDTLQASAEVWVGLPFAKVTPLAHAADMTVPLLVIHDDTDREMPISDARELVAVWPGAELVETSQLGHHSILTDASVIARAVEFVRT